MSRAGEGDRSFDVVLFGVTGYTGKLVARYLEHMHNAGRLSPEVRIAYAGRNIGAVRLLARQLSPKLSAQNRLGHIEADVKQPDTVFAMARQAKVILTCVGPFEQYGEIVIKACVESGTDYVDITGEGRWVESMKKKYEEPAKENGVILVPFAGHDCVPADLCAWFATSQISPQEMEESHAALITACALPSDAGMSHGTFQTILNMLEKGEVEQYDPIKVACPKLSSDYVQELKDIPVEEGGPLVILPTRLFLDGKVVEDSHTKPTRGRPEVFEGKHGLVVPNKLAGYSLHLLLSAAPYILRFPLLLTLMRKAISSGSAFQPPQFTKRASNGVVYSMFGVLHIYPANDAEVQSKTPVETIVVRLDADREPYAVTAICCTQIALALANDEIRSACPGNADGGGFQTPTSALGGQLLFEKCYECFRARLVSRM